MRWEVVSPLLLLAAWQLLAMVFPGRLFPTPIDVAIELWRDTVEGKLLSDMGKTLWRAAVAFVIAMSLGTAIGIAFGRNRIADRLSVGGRLDITDATRIDASALKCFAYDGCLLGRIRHTKPATPSAMTCSGAAKQGVN